MIKLIVSDLDETLLGADGSVSEENKLAIKKAREKGVKFVPNTGRGFASIQELLKVLDLYSEPDEYVISYNGGAIVENKNQKVLQTNGLSFEQASDIFNITKKFKDFDTHVYTLNDVFLYNPLSEDEAYLRTRGVNFKYLEADNLDEFKDTPIIKVITMNSDPVKQQEMAEAVLSGVYFDLNVTYS
ncbi:hypothetical protein LSA03_15860 [Pediococcus argentinicus]|nr:hypothetical protein LSA03_15860 [Pediococcus argentinicus]